MATDTGLTTTQPSIADIIRQVAAELGVNPDLAVATAYQESGLNPTARGDRGCSFGLFQLNICGGEGTGMSVAQLEDPYTNARTALSRFAAIQSGYSDPGQLAAAAQRPADPSAYADAIDALLKNGIPGMDSSHPSSGGAGGSSNSGTIDFGPFKLSTAPIWKIGFILGGVMLVLVGITLFVLGHIEKPAMAVAEHA